MLEVVVLPCVPVTAIVGLQPRQLAEQLGAVQLALAALARVARSGFSGGIALETTTSAPSGTLAASWPAAGSTPSARSGARYGEPGARSEPGDLGAERARDQREAAHPGAADADEVQPAAAPGVLVAHGR